MKLPTPPSIPKQIRGVRATVSEAEWEARVDLAAAYRLVAREGWDELLSTHLSARVPDQPDHYLVNPWGVLFKQITASSLIKVDAEGNKCTDSPYPLNPAVAVIHGGIMKARPDVHSAMHLHTPAGVAVSLHRDGLLPIHQRAAYFQRILGYHDYGGLEVEHERAPELLESLGDHWMLLLRGHGSLTVGRSVGQAYVYLFMLERMCQMQVATLAGNPPLRVMPPEVVEHTSRQAEGHVDRMGRFEWPALRALLDDEEPSYRD